jgi:iron complex outermembrane receptor protein
VALIYNPWTDTTLKAIYGTAFRVPNFLELAYANPATLPDPEEITTYELVGEQKINEHLRATLSLYYNDIEDLITVPRGDYTRNLEGATAMGVETGIEGTWDGLRARIGYAYQQTEDRETDEVLTDSPAHLVDAAVSVPFFRERFFASTELQYTSARDTLWGTEADDFFVVNLVLYGRNVVKGLDASVGVYNLFDADYADPAGSVPYHVQDVIPQDGITFQVKLTYRF